MPLDPDEVARRLEVAMLRGYRTTFHADPDLVAEEDDHDDVDDRPASDGGS